MRFGIVVPVVLALYASAQPPAAVRLEIRDYATLTVTGRVDGTGQTDGLLARVTSLREEPGGRQRFFLNDLNGPLYILDKRTKALTTYLDFNGRDSRKGLFRKLSFEVGWANGLNSFQFDPDYARNGRFYTVHTEDPALPGSSVPDATHFPGLKIDGYAPTEPIVTPGSIQREGVLIEWSDSNPANQTFEGSARELLRVQLNTRVHPLGDLSFNPYAQRGDAEWGVLYIGCGDGGSGESVTTRVAPQPTTARHSRRQDPPNHPGSVRASRNKRRQRQRTLPRPTRQPVRGQDRGTPGDLGVRFSQSSPPDVGEHVEYARRRATDCEFHRPAHLGDREHRSQGCELWLFGARGHRSAGAAESNHRSPGCRRDPRLHHRHHHGWRRQTHVSRRAIRATPSAAATPSGAATSTAAICCPPFAISTSSQTSQRDGCGASTTKRCCVPTMAIR